MLKGLGPEWALNEDMDNDNTVFIRHEGTRGRQAASDSAGGECPGADAEDRRPKQAGLGQHRDDWT